MRTPKIISVVTAFDSLIWGDGDGDPDGRCQNNYIEFAWAALEAKFPEHKVNVDVTFFDSSSSIIVMGEHTPETYAEIGKILAHAYAEAWRILTSPRVA